MRHTLCPQHEKELKLWYGWTGHQSGLRRTIKTRVIHGLSNNYHKLIADLNDVYDACVFAKNKKQPHYTGTRTFHHQGEMLHIDFHEKSTLSYHHNWYSISIIEDYSGADLSHFIKKKSCAGRTIINVIRKLERQADVKVKIVQCDGASEFIGKNTDLGKFCRNKRIEIWQSSPDCPEKNGMAEKGNETCWNTAQAMRLTACLLSKFWKFVEKMASKLISLMVKEGQKITPFEKLYETKPSMNLIQTFGCHTFTHIPCNQCSKTDLKSQAAINLGLAENMNRFLLYDPIAMKTVRISVFLVWRMFDLMENIICEFYDYKMCYPEAPHFSLSNGASSIWIWQLHTEILINHWIVPSRIPLLYFRPNLIA